VNKITLIIELPNNTSYSLNHPKQTSSHIFTKGVQFVLAHLKCVEPNIPVLLARLKNEWLKKESKQKTKMRYHFFHLEGKRVFCIRFSNNNNINL
jgi:hypothetical protein